MKFLKKLLNLLKKKSRESNLTARKARELTSARTKEVDELLIDSMDSVIRYIENEIVEEATAGKRSLKVSVTRCITDDRVVALEGHGAVYRIKTSELPNTKFRKEIIARLSRAGFKATNNDKYIDIVW